MMGMSENTTTNENSDQQPPASSQTTVQEKQQTLPEPKKKKGRWKPSFIWLIPVVALLIGLSLAVKAVLNTGPTIEVSFRTAEGIVAGKTTVQFRQVNIGLV